jgi:hypothetical protein
VGAEIDADAEGAHLGRRFIDADAARHARGVERKRQGQPADSATNDDNVHDPTLARHVDLEPDPPPRNFPSQIGTARPSFAAWRIWRIAKNREATIVRGSKAAK